MHSSSTPIFSNRQLLPTFQRWWKSGLGLCATRRWYKASQCIDPKCHTVGRAVPTAGLPCTHSRSRLIWLARRWRRGLQLCGARDCCQCCSRESFCDKECVFPKADTSSWDILLVLHAAAHGSIGEVETWMGLSILLLQNLLFREGSQWLQHKQREGCISPPCRGTGMFGHWGRWRLSRISSKP